MKDLENRLPAKYFMRIHKSYIVSLPNIVMIEGDEVSIKNYKEKIFISDTYKNQLMEKLGKKLM